MLLLTLLENFFSCNVKSDNILFKNTNEYFNKAFKQALVLHLSDLGLTI